MVLEMKNSLLSFTILLLFVRKYYSKNDFSKYFFIKKENFYYSKNCKGTRFFGYQNLNLLRIYLAICVYKSSSSIVHSEYISNLLICTSLPSFKICLNVNFALLMCFIIMNNIYVLVETIITANIILLHI